MFVFVFLGSAIIPIEYKSDALQANMSPVLSMRSVPKQLKNNVKSISGYSGFTIGVSKDNTMYIWGATKDNLTKYNYKNFPSAIQKNKVVEASAGLDHIVAITTDGKVVAWGNNFNGQYGRNFKEDDPRRNDARRIDFGYDRRDQSRSTSLRLSGNGVSRRRQIIRLG